MNNVFIVDDDPEIRNVLKEVLILYGYTPYEADSGIEALNHFKNTRFLAVLLDLNMPGMGGFETMQHH